MTVVAVREAPAIICPQWCVVTRETHLADFDPRDPWIVHWSADRPAGAGCRIRIATSTTPDGAPDPTDPPQLFIEDNFFHDGTGLDEARAFAEGILAALEVAQA